MADVSGKITANNITSTALAATSTWTHAKVVIRNESLVDVWLYCPGDGTTPTATATCNNGSVVRVGEMRELFDPSEGEDLSQWWVACKPLTGPAVITFTA